MFAGAGKVPTGFTDIDLAQTLRSDVQGKGEVDLSFSVFSLPSCLGREGARSENRGWYAIKEVAGLRAVCDSKVV